MIPRRRIDLAWSDLRELFKQKQSKRSLSLESDVRIFEKRFAQFVGTRFAKATSSGRAAILLALEALGVQPGDEVLVPAYTLGELLEVLRSAGYLPRAVDIEPDTFNMAPKALQNRITSRSRAVLATHLLGAPCDIVAICQIARKADLVVVEDCAHAMGARVNGQHVGTFGDAGIFSFEVNKAVPTYGGGMVITDRPEVKTLLSNRLEILSAGKNAIRKKVFRTWLEESFVRSPIYGLAARILFSPRIAEGFEKKYRAGNDQSRPQEAYSDFQARLGLRRLEMLDERNRLLNKKWDQLEACLPESYTPQNRDRHGSPAFYNFVALAPAHIHKLRSIAFEMGIDLALGSEIEDDCGQLLHDDDCPVASNIFSRAFMLPLYTGMSDSKFRFIQSKVSNFPDEKKEEEKSEVILARIISDKEVGIGVHPRHFAAPLSLYYIEAGLLARGQSSKIRDMANTRLPQAEFLKRLQKDRPKIAVLMANSASMKTAAKIANQLQKVGITTVAIGQQVHHQTLIRDENWWNSFDVVLNGEPEETAPAIIETLLSGKQIHPPKLDQPQIVKDPNKLPTPIIRPSDLEKYPFPFPIAGLKARRWGYVLSAWGCPHRCQHCSWALRKTFGRTWRPRKPKQVVDEIAERLAAGAEAICFEDENLLHSSKHVREIFAECAQRGLRFPWIAHARPDSMTEKIIADIAQAGAALLKVGVESGSPEIVERLCKASSGEMWVQNVESGFRLLDRHGIGSVAMFMIGSSEETRADVEKTMTLARRIRPTYIQVHIFCPYPDTDFFQSLENEKQKQAATCLYQYADSPWSPSQIPTDHLLELQKRFYRRFYLHPGFIARHIWRNGLIYAREGELISQAARSILWVLSSRGFA